VRVLNATGIFLHTNLGRAPLPVEVADGLAALSTAACDLELDLSTGRRGDRAGRLEGLLAELTGAEAARVANNSAAALLLALAALAFGRESSSRVASWSRSAGRSAFLRSSRRRRPHRRSRHDQPDAPRRLRKRHRPGDRAAAQGARQQLPHLRLRGSGRGAGAG
jgi:hypothetical protein